MIIVGMMALISRSAIGGTRVDETLDWNAVLVDAVLSAGIGGPTPVRSAAIVHVAMFDAYNGIEQRYTPIHFDMQAPPGASRRAALIQAAFATLSKLYPSQQAKFDAQRAASLAALSEDQDDVNDGQSISLGLTWGDSVAKDILAWRASDGFTAVLPPFNGGSAVGQWRPTPPAFAPMAVQQFAFMTPFALTSVAQFRPPRPRDLAGSAWESDYNMVKLMGSQTGSGRSADQTNIAFFFNGVGLVHWADAATALSRSHHLSRSANARLFALLFVSGIDTAITTWSAKRFYGADPTSVTWRPITAIRLGDTDGNPDTVQDPAWTPLINTPAHPDYPAGHPSSNGAAAEVLTEYFGDDDSSFTMTYPSFDASRCPGGLVPECAASALRPGVPNSRSYTSIAQAEQDANNARLYGGMHYPSSIAASSAEGHTVAKHVIANVAQSVHGKKAGQISHDHGEGNCHGDGEVPNDDGSSY